MFGFENTKITGTLNLHFVYWLSALLGRNPDDEFKVSSITSLPFNFNVHDYVVKLIEKKLRQTTSIWSSNGFEVIKGNSSLCFFFKPSLMRSSYITRGGGGGFLSLSIHPKVCSYTVTAAHSVYERSS